jgi:RNA polymerase sigma factor (sigma-70 family)
MEAGDRDHLAHTGSDLPEGTSGMEKESDGTLLYYMSCRSNPADIALSDAAGREFHHRHMGALFARCARICRKAGASDGFEKDLAMTTLAKAVQRADRYTDSPDVSNGPRRTQAWLGSIAHNLLIDSLRNPNRPGPITGTKDELPSEDYSDDELAALLCDDHSLPRSRETIRLVREALPTLPERTQFVLVQTVLQRTHSPKGTYMYRGSAANLAQGLGTTPENVRRVRKNGLKALADYIRSHSGPS